MHSHAVGEGLDQARWLTASVWRRWDPWLSQHLFTHSRCQDPLPLHVIARSPQVTPALTAAASPPPPPDPHDYSRLMHLWEPVSLLQPWQHCPPQTLTLREQQREERVRRRRCSAAPAPLPSPGPADRKGGKK